MTKTNNIVLLLLLGVVLNCGCVEKKPSVIDVAIQSMDRSWDAVAVSGWKQGDNLEELPYSNLVIDSSRVKRVCHMLKEFLGNASVSEREEIGQAPRHVWRIVTLMNFETRKTTSYLIEESRLFLGDGTELFDADPATDGDIIVGRDLQLEIDQIMEDG